jgi:hypothetical protein
MVLYCINHPSLPIWAITRHITAHSDEELVIMSFYPSERLPVYTDNIRFIHDYVHFPGLQTAEVEEVKAEIIKYYDALFEKAGVDIENLTEIYLIIDSLMVVSLYFALKKIPCVLIESRANQSNNAFSLNDLRFRRLVENYKKLYLEYGWRALKKTLYHENTTKFDGKPPYEYFNYFETLNNMSAERKEKLLSFFKFDKKALENKTFSVFFPNSPPLFFDTLKYNISRPKLERLYYTHIQYFLDFYGDESIAYKAHPFSVELAATSDLDDYIDNTIIPTECLSELLPLIKGLALENIYGTFSTSLVSLSPFAKRVYSLGVKYFYYFPNLPSVYFPLFLADAHKLYNLSSQNIDRDQIKKYAELAFPELAKGLSETPSKMENSLQIVNMREVMNAPGIKDHTPIFNAAVNLHHKAAALALINFDYKSLFNDSLFNCGFINKFCLLVKIEKVQVKPKVLADLNEEYILLYVKDAALRSEMLKTNVNKVLPNTGVKLVYKIFALSKFRTPVLEFKTGEGREGNHSPTAKINYYGAQTITKFNKSLFLQNNIFGNNIGNIFFSNAVYKHLALNPNNEFSGTAYDIHIMPLANPLEPYAEAHLLDYTKLINESKARAVVVGIGGGGRLNGKMDFNAELKEVHKDFCKAVLNRSASIGVRGEWTRDYLVDTLGFPADCIDVIGCPSLRYYGRYFDKTCKPYVLQDLKYMKINTNFTAYEYNKTWADYMNYVWKDFPNSDVLFTDKEEGDLLWNNIEITNKERLYADLPQTKEHFMIRQNRTYFHISEVQIIKHLSKYDFSLGTRIHGTVAAALAGIPVMQIASGLRQLEIADFHSIPYVLTEDLPKYTLERLYEKSLEGMKGFYANYNKNLQIYVDFLKKNEVPVNYEYLTPDPNEYTRA